MEYLTAVEIAEITGRTKRTVLRIAKNGGWPHGIITTIGGKRRIFPVDSLPGHIQHLYKAEKAFKELVAIDIESQVKKAVEQMPEEDRAGFRIEWQEINKIFFERTLLGVAWLSRD